MVVNCCIIYCVSRSGVTNDLSFHSFPKDKRKDEWIKFCEDCFILVFNETSNKRYVYRPSHRLCSKHFETDQFERDLKSELTGDKRRNILLPSAVPTNKQIFKMSPQKSDKFEPALGGLNIVMAENVYESEMILGL